LPAITNDLWLTNVSSINLYRLALASVTFSVVVQKKRLSDSISQKRINSERERYYRSVKNCSTY
jgi:hypothetical protein